MSVARRRIGSVVISTAVAVVVPVCGQLAMSAAAVKSGSAAATAPAVPATGRFHVVAPTPVAAWSRLAAGSSRLVTVGGHAGVPRTGVAAVAVTLTAVAPSGATQLYAAATSTRPVVPSLATGGATASSFAIVPTTADGRFRVFTGPHATGVHVDVTGWFSSVSQTGRAGLFARLAGRQVASASLGAGVSHTFTLTNREDVPAIDVAAVLLRLRTSQATRAGKIGIAGTAKAAGQVTALAYPSGTARDLAVGRLSSTGTLVVRNQGTKPVTVALDAVGWFTNGANAQATGDVLHVIAPHALLSRHVVTTAGAVTPIAGVGAVPSETAAVPPSLVLARTLATNPDKAAGLTVDATGTSPTHVTGLAWKASQPVAGLLLAQPGPTSSSRWATTAGKATVSAESFGYFAGGVVVSDTMNVLAPTATTAITDVQPTSVTFSGVPASLSDLAVGDVIVAGISTTTPAGLNRQVVSTDTSSGNLVVTTTDAPFGAGVIQGSVSVGTLATVPTAKAAALAVPQAKSPNTSTENCNESGSPLFGSASLTCELADDDGFVSTTVTTTVNFSETLFVDIGFTGARLTAGADVSASAVAVADASVDKTVSRSFPLGERPLEPIEFAIGPVPVVIVPVISGTVNLNGEVKATFKATGQIQAGLSVSYDSEAGFLTSHSAGGSGSATYGQDATATLHGDLNAGVDLRLYDRAEEQVRIALVPAVDLKADRCTVSGEAGVELVFSLHVELPFKTIDASYGVPLIHKNLFTRAWRNCAVWSGHVDYKVNGDWFNADGTEEQKYKSSSSGSINPTSVPPTDDIYSVTASGSGIYIDRQDVPCGNPPTLVWGSYTDSWDGAVTVLGDPMVWKIETVDADLGSYQLVSNGAAGWFYMHDVRTSDTYSTNQLGECVHNPMTSEEVPQWSLATFGFIYDDTSTGAGDGSMLFTLAPGTATATGTRTVPANGSSPKFTVTWSLTKTCTKGGTAC